MAESRICSIEGCGKPHMAHSYCQSHYNRMRKHGHPLAGKKSTASHGDPAKFIQDVALPYSGEDCLIWPYATSGNGYGTIYLEGKVRLVHRVICEAAHGLSSLHVAHSCGHRACCNPKHLRWATRSENMMDRLVHGTHNRGEQHPLSKLRDSDIPAIRELFGKMKHKEIAAKFGVSHQVISCIRRNITWGWVP